MENSEKEKTLAKGRSVLVITSFEIEVVGCRPYTVHEEIDLTKLDSRELIEDWDENENSPKD